ncbi:MAG: ABC transporter ATP-binding protein [Sarcina sp.]
MERSSGIKIMKRLLKELSPLKWVMFITIIFGVLGFLSAISITSFGAIAMGIVICDITNIELKVIVISMILAGVLRGFLRYGEQLSGHYIAFKILYILRDKIFKKLRELGPAKLEGKEKGNLISLITSDIELLEVFYAHTIAPIAIAIITNSIIVIILYKINYIFGVLAAIFYLIIGFIIPYFSSFIGKKSGLEYRNILGKCNNYMFDSLRGLKEILQFDIGEQRLNEINKKSKIINEKLDKIKIHEGIIRATTDLTINLAVVTFIVVGAYKYFVGEINFSSILIATVIIASSFGPVVALSNLSNTLFLTFACAQRLFDLMDEKAKVKEVVNGVNSSMDEVSYNNVSFGYKNRNNDILRDINLKIKKGEKIALIGESGAGKSTFIKLLMRFFDVDKGEINIGKNNIKDVNTKYLNDSKAVVSQETYLFNESILENIKIGNINASSDEVVEASKKASIHEFILSLPNGYQTKVGELGDKISSGEKQRIGLARAFLKNSTMLILDEPTSNLDTLNEATILKSIKENSRGKTVILISHRLQTTAICDRTFKIKNKQLQLK